MRWIWLRHGETEANTQGRYLGHSDSPLTPRGQAQIDQAAEQLLKTLTHTTGELTNPIKLYTSDLGRCVQTATRIGARLNVVPVQVEALRELYFGRWEGLTYEGIMRVDREHAMDWYDNAWEVAPPGGETLRELGSRIDSWVDSVLLTADPADTIIVISHGGPIRWFLSQYIRGDASAYWEASAPQPGSCIQAEYDGQSWRLIEGI